MSNAWPIIPLLICLLGAPLTCPARETSTPERIEQMGPSARQRLKPRFARQRVDYPPQHLALVVVKDERRMKIYARNSSDESWRFICQYQVARLSGKAGPKLKAGDLQVPEGVYSITHLNPNSKFWLSLALNYPNSFDRRQATRDGRTRLGSDIMIHGWWFSEGCVAMGNTAIEDLFVLTHDTGLNHTRVIISPTDFRQDSTNFTPPAKPAWTKELYANLKDELNSLGTDGLSRETRLVSYGDTAPPPPPPTTLQLIGEILHLLANVSPTTSTVATDITTSPSDTQSTVPLEKDPAP